MTITRTRRSSIAPAQPGPRLVLDPNRTLHDVWGSAGNDVYAVGDEVALTYDGMRWTQMGSGTNWDLTSVWGSSASDVFVVGDRLLLRHAP